jgi:hypothetical protein
LTFWMKSQSYSDGKNSASTLQRSLRPPSAETSGNKKVPLGSEHRLLKHPQEVQSKDNTRSKKLKIRFPTRLIVFGSVYVEVSTRV